MRARYPFAVLAAALILAVAFIMAASRAWACDDAFITFRVVAQLLDGHGPVFNIGERVQVFTHPLWFIALGAWSAAGASLFPGVIWLSLAAFGTGLAFLFLAFRDKPLALAVAGAMMTFSQSLMDFATSGLETPLSFALFAAALWALRSGRRGSSLVLLALLPLNRLDLLPWAMPFAWLAAEPRLKPRARALAVVCMPALAWVVFSTIYYGEPFPNTAWAKLGVPMTQRLDQGLAYVAASFAHDPGAMAIAVVAAVLAWRARRIEPRWVAAAGASALIGCAYPVWSGGDFMLGRFILPALWASLALVLAAFPAVEPAAARRERRAAAYALACLAAFLLVTGHSTTNLWIGMKNESLMRSVGFAGATDERRVYLPWLGAYAPGRLAVVRGQGPAPTPEPQKVSMLGQSGYLGRDDQAMIDVWALADPFLARFAPLASSRPGHPYRPLRTDFARWREAGYSFGDARLDALARDLRLAHLSDDLWSGKRWAAIARLPGYAPIPQDALLVSDAGDAVRIDLKPWRLFRPWPDAASYYVWLRLHDAGKLRYRAPLPTALDRDCAPVAVPPLSDDAGAFEVRSGESLSLRCPKALLGREAILLRIGALQTVDGKTHIEYDEATEAVRPAFWWLSGWPGWLVQGWTEKPKPAVTVAIVLLAFAAFAWRSGRKP